MTTPPPVLPPRPAGPGSSVRRALDSELAELFAISPQALMLFDKSGRIWQTNAPLQALAGRVNHIGELGNALAGLLGWPGELPPVGSTREMLGWIEAPQDQRLRARIRVRSAGTAMPPRWLAQIEDLSADDARDLSKIEITALMGTAGVGVATYDSARGWVTSSAGRGAGGGSAEGGPNTALMSIGRDVVEPASLPEYERLQQALRKRERAEVRYAVRHRDTGQRWLMSRVEPAELSPGRPVCTVVTLDVSEEESSRQRNAQLLRELSTILDLNPAGMAYLRGSEVLRSNRRFEALLGLAEGSATGQSFDNLLVRAGVPGASARQALLNAVQQGLCEVEYQLPISPQRPQAVWVSLALRRASEAGPGPSEIVAVLTDITRLRAQQAEMEGLERERELMFSLSDVGIIYQREGRIERANQAIAEMTGRPQESLKGLALSELYEDERAYLNYSAHERRDLSLHGRAVGERRLTRRDGSGFWAQVSVRPVDPQDPGAGAICSFVSVDERRRARETLLVQADRTRAILDSVLVGIVTVGDQGIEWMNRSARRMFGGELADFIAQPISVVASDDPEHPLRRTNWLATLEEGQAETFECKLTARDGRDFWVVGNAVVTGRDSGAGQLTFALLDIERRREAEAQIAQARASLQRIIETAPLAIALFDANNQQVLQLNQAMTGFARRPASEILSRPPALWLTGPEAAALNADLHHAMATHEMVRRELQREANPESGDAAEVWDMRIVSLQAGNDDEEQLLLVASDVTEQRAADEARLVAAISQREMLIKEVHHRIKNNLQGVAGLLQQNAQRHPEAAAAIAEAVGHVHAIAQVHGLQVGMTGPLRVQKVIEAIAASVQRMFGRTISLEVSGPSPQRFALTEADSIPIALTINELFTNAIKHSGGGDASAQSPGNEVRCSLEVGQNDLCISVRNRGRLAPDFHISQIPSGISGLGLVRALLPRKGAAISLEAEGEDVVARLRLSPPAVAV